MSTAATRSPISDDELRRAVAASLGEVRALTRSPSRYATSASLEDVHVELAAGQRMTLMLKDLSRGALLHDALRHKPAFLYDPRREIEIYRQVLAHGDLGTPRCHVAVADAREERFWLLLEKVAGVELYQVGEIERWAEVGAWLALMHEQLDRFRERATVPWLVYDADHYRLFAARACEVLAARDDPRAGEVVDWLERAYDRVVDGLLALPTTVIHGEFYASNVLVGVGSGASRVCPVDWEMTAIGPGLTDLAALVSGWSTAARARIADAYRAALPPGSGFANPREFSRALSASRLALCVQWLGWAPGWRPPAENAHDWLGDAWELVRTLDR